MTSQVGDAPVGTSPVAENALQALIATRRAELGLSYSQLADRCGLARSTIHYLATTPALQRAPSASTLERLALALQLPLKSVRHAAAEALGVHVYEEGEADPELAVLIASLEQLSREDRQHVVALVRSLLGRSTGHGASEDGASAES